MLTENLYNKAMAQWCWGRVQPRSRLTVRLRGRVKIETKSQAPVGVRLQRWLSKEGVGHNEKSTLLTYSRGQ